MEKRRLGKHGPEISPIGIGAMSFSNFYGPTDEAQSHAILNAALDEGVTHICLLYTSDAADDLTRVDLGGRRIIKKKKTPHPPPPPPDAPPPSLFFFFFSSRRRHTRFLYVSWARRCV